MKTAKRPKAFAVSRRTFELLSHKFLRLILSTRHTNKESLGHMGDQIKHKKFSKLPIAAAKSTSESSQKAAVDITKFFVHFKFVSLMNQPITIMNQPS